MQLDHINKLYEYKEVKLPPNTLRGWKKVLGVSESTIRSRVKDKSLTLIK